MIHIRCWKVSQASKGRCIDWGYIRQDRSRTCNGSSCFDISIAHYTSRQNEGGKSQHMKRFRSWNSRGEFWVQTRSLWVIHWSCIGAEQIKSKIDLLWSIFKSHESICSLWGDSRWDFGSNWSKSGLYCWRWGNRWKVKRNSLNFKTQARMCWLLVLIRSNQFLLNQRSQTQVWQSLLLDAIEKRAFLEYWHTDLLSFVKSY